MINRYIGRAEAAKYLSEQLGLKVSKNTLQKWATTGGGPMYRIFGRAAVYLHADLEEWAEKKLSTPRHSTSA